MIVQQFVVADQTINTTTGGVVPPAAGTAPIADGAGGAAWGVLTDAKLVSQTKSLSDQAQSLAPAGLRDTWQIPPGLAFSGEFLYRFDESDLLLTTSATSNHYSLDGGITWAPVVFDVPPTTPVYFGYDGVGQYVGLSFTAADPTYASIDGINFVAGPSLGAIANSWQILWVARLGFWVASVHNNATHWISTSPDGVTWTPRATPDFLVSGNGITLIDTGSILVMIGDAFAWSTNGVTWFAGTPLPPIGQLQTGCYSADRDEFIATGGSTNNLYRSDDGKTWTNLGLVGVGASVAAIWVGGDIQRYYLARRDNTTGLYSMFTSRDPQVEPFVSTTLAGAVSNTQAYGGVVYDATRKRFLLGLDTVGVAYSTNSPYTLKSVTDNINVRGYPVGVTKYVRLADGPGVGTSSIAEASLYPSGAVNGSLVFPMPQAIGTAIHAHWGVVASVAAGSTLTLRLNTNFAGGPTEICNFSVPGPLVGRAFILDAAIVLAGVSDYKLLQSVLGNGLPLAVRIVTNPGWNRSLANTLSFTAQFDVSNPANVATGTLATVDVTYPA